MSGQRSFARLCRYYPLFTAGFAAFLLALSVLGTGRHAARLDRLPVHARHHHPVRATIGVISRTSNVTELRVRWCQLEKLNTGMATAADWISAASFISLAGGLYLNGFDGLAFIMGWTGGYCLVALLIAPYLRKFSQYTIFDFLAARYGSGADKRGPACAWWPWPPPSSCRFTYVVAQLRRRPDRLALYGRGFFRRHLPGPGQHPGLLFSWRHARHYLDGRWRSTSSSWSPF